MTQIKKTQSGTWTMKGTYSYMEFTDNQIQFLINLKSATKAFYDAVVHAEREEETWFSF